MLTKVLFEHQSMDLANWFCGWNSQNQTSIDASVSSSALTERLKLLLQISQTILKWDKLLLSYVDYYVFFGCQKAIFNCSHKGCKFWERPGLGVCIWTAEVSVLLRQLSVFKGSSGQSCHTDPDNNRMCYVFDSNTAIPTLRRLVSLVAFFLSINENPSPFRTSLKTKKKRKWKRPTKAPPVHSSPRHMCIPCLSSIINNVGKMRIDTFPVTK